MESRKPSPRPRQAPRPARLAATLITALAVALAATAGAQLQQVAPLPGDQTPAPLFGSQLQPHVAAGPNGYMAVWADERMALEPTVELDPWEVVASDIYAARLAPDGTPVDLAPIHVDGTAFSQVAPKVASNGTDWLVVFESRSESSTTFFTTQDVRAVRISGSGQVLDATPLAIDTSDGEAYVPQVGSDGSSWAVVWTDASTIWGRIIGADGSMSDKIAAHSAGTWVFDPALAWAGDRYLMVWQRNVGIFGRFLDANLQPLSGSFVISTDGTDPQIATDGTDFFVTIADLGQWAEIRGTVVRADGTVVTPNGALLDGQSFLALTPSPVAWDGSGYVMSWVESRFVFPQGSESILQVNRVDANGALTTGGPQTLMATFDFSIREPVAASLGTGDAFLGWLDNRNSSKGQYDGYGTLADTALGFGAQSPFMVSAPAQLFPDLVAGPTGATVDDDVNLAVFVSADSAETRVVFQRMDGAGNALDPEPVTIAGGTDTFRDPAAAWNGTEWLVAWEDSKGGTGNGGVLAARVLPDGTLLDATPIAVLEGNDPDVDALDVVDGAFLVAASQLTSGDIRTIYGRRVGGDGTLLDGSKLFLGVNYATSASIGGFDDRWIVTWHRRPTHDTPSSSLQARFVLADGTVQPLIDPSNSTTDEMLPDVAIAGNVATIAWADGTDIRVRRMLKNGDFLDPPAGLVVSAAPNEQTSPSVSVDGTKTVVTWVDDRIHGQFEPGVGDLFGARLDGSFVLLEPDGQALAADPGLPEGESGLTGRMGVTTIAWPAMLDSYGTWRVVTGTWRDWDSMGMDLPGSKGSPRLFLSGLLSPGSTVTMDIRDTDPFAPGLQIVGASNWSTPWLGGTVVPYPDIVLPIQTNALGQLSFSTQIVTPLPPGADLYVQTWVADPTAPQGAAATQALHARVP